MLNKINVKETKKIYLVYFVIGEYSDTAVKCSIFSWNSEKEVWEKIKKIAKEEWKEGLDEKLDLGGEYYEITSEYGTIKVWKKEERMTPVYNIWEVSITETKIL